MRRHRPEPALGCAALLTALACTATLSLAQRAAPAAPADHVQAVAKPSRDLELAFTTAGRVAVVHVQPGQQVQAGQPLIDLDDAATRAQLQLLTLRAESDLAVRSAEASLRLAQNDEARIREALSRDAAAPFELERAQLQTLQAQLTLELARQRRREAQLTLAQAQEQAAQLRLFAPAAGVVERVDVEPGETVQAHQTVLRLVAIDPLRVEAAIPTERTLSIEPGDAVWAVWPLAKRPRALRGRVVHIAAVADPASQTRTVVCLMPNPEKLPAGAGVQLWLVEPPLAEAPSARDRPAAPSAAPAARSDGATGGQAHAQRTHS